RGGGGPLLEGALLLHGPGERLQMARFREPHLHGADRQRKVLRAVRQVVRGARRGPLSDVGPGPRLHAHAVPARVETRLTAETWRWPETDTGSQESWGGECAPPECRTDELPTDSSGSRFTTEILRESKSGPHTLAAMTWLTEGERDPRPAGDRLADLWAEPGILGRPGAHDPLAALLARRAGFRALYLSGAALSASLGLPDLGVLTLDELTYFTRGIVRASGLPVLVDGDTGYGEVLNVVRLVRE